jgi:hypothetical protein
MGIIQLAREGSPPPGLRLTQAELSRKSNQLVRARIRQFESYMPSQANAATSQIRGYSFDHEVWAALSSRPPLSHTPSAAGGSRNPVTGSLSSPRRGFHLGDSQSASVAAI